MTRHMPRSALLAVVVGKGLEVRSCTLENMVLYLTEVEIVEVTMISPYCRC